MKYNIIYMKMQVVTGKKTEQMGITFHYDGFPKEKQVKDLC